MMTADGVAEVLLGKRVRLCGFYRAVLADGHRAEDVFPEVCVKAVREADQFTDAQHVERWAIRVGKNRALDLLRRDGRRVEFSLAPEVIDLLVADEEAADPRDDGVRIRALGRCLGKLGRRSREVVALRYGERMAGTAIARRLGRKVDTVYKMLARSYAALRECVARELAKEGKP